MNNDYQIILIGSGIVGLSIAKSLAENDFSSVLIIEKEETYGRGISSRNSEVIHSGVYYQKNSSKSRLCLDGNKKIYSFCEQYSIWHRRCGKLIIGHKDQHDLVHRLYKNAQENNVSEIKILKKNEIPKYEKHIIGDIALYSGSTGIVSSHQLMDRLYNISQNKLHDYLFKTLFLDSTKTQNGYKTKLKNHSGQIETVTSDWVINCAGLHSDMINKNIPGIPAIYFSKGSYFKLSKKWTNIFNHLVYPIPDENNKTLGIHLTIDRDGSAKLGPSAEELPNKEENYYVNENQKSLFYNEAKKYIKNLSISDLQPDYSGIRPKLQSKNNALPDFYIKHEQDSGFSKWINLIGVESPGLTASLAIGDYIVDIIDKYLD